MENLPNDVLKLIFITLDPGNMLLVNKRFNSLHDDNFYYQYLKEKYPDKNLWCPDKITYKELFTRSLKQRKCKIYGSYYNYFIEPIGIKFKHFGHQEDYYLILDFCGNIYWSYDSEPLETCVSDIGYNSQRQTYYIKNNHKYYVLCIEQSLLVVILNSEYSKYQYCDNSNSLIIHWTNDYYTSHCLGEASFLIKIFI
jgi:hypothetical protein